jgi:hypothetical protein
MKSLLWKNLKNGPCITTRVYNPQSPDPRQTPTTMTLHPRSAMTPRCHTRFHIAFAGAALDVDRWREREREREKFY